LDGRAIGAGATGQNGGFLPVCTTESYQETIDRHGPAMARTLQELTERNYEVVRGLILNEEIECDFREPGHLRLALHPAEVAAFSRSKTLLEADGFSWGTMLERAELEAEVRTALGDRIVAGARVRGGLLHSMKLLIGLAAAAQRRGARCRLAQVLSLRSAGSGPVVVTASGVISAGSVLVATNALLDELVPRLKRVVTPVRGQVLVTEPLPSFFRSGMSAALTPTEEYWQQTPSGEIVLGGCRAVRQNGDREVRSTEPTADVQSALDTVLPTLFPALQGVHIAGRWAGTMGFTRDHAPVVDRVLDLPRSWFAGGYSGHGMAFSGVIGALLRDAIAHDHTSPQLRSLGCGRPTLNAAGFPPV
jgi:glycine/D-amino acid oxidase-like deaminating enzyme